jgi:UDP-glucose 4-epimerase
MKVLVTGGAGFIGTHTCVELLRRGHRVVVADNFRNSSPAALDAVRRVAGADLTAYEMDMRDAAALDDLFAAEPVDAVIHFAALKSVRESAQIPLEYYGNNLGSTIELLSAMTRHDVRKLVFSGSCSIYGAAYDEPIAEDFATGPTNPYANTKLMCEQILRDACTRWPDLSVVSLRYFNPIGGHPSGALGEDPKGVPSNVLPYMMQVAVGRLEKLQVYGGDWETPDGSGVRDYIHVLDVAEAHCVAMEHLDDERGLRAFNLGTGAGVSVLELIAAFQEASGIEIPYEIIGRQPGDVATLIADPTRIDKAWGWRTTRDLPTMCADAWRFQREHSHGYAAKQP